MVLSMLGLIRAVSTKLAALSCRRPFVLCINGTKMHKYAMFTLKTFRNCMGRSTFGNVGGFGEAGRCVSGSEAKLKLVHSLPNIFEEELIAPAFVEFYDAEWDDVGTKSSLCRYISSVTFIDELVLRGADPTKRTIGERMSWAASRSTTRIEDTAYCLMGLFNVFMPMLYGEGSRAFIRLQEEILKQEEDYTIFVWKSESGDSADRGLFAHSPAEFLGSEVAVGVPSQLGQQDQPATTLLTSRGLRIDLPLLLLSPEHNTHLAWVCYLKPEDQKTIEKSRTILCVILRQLQSNPEIFVRSSPNKLVARLETDAPLFVRRQVYVLPSGTVGKDGRKRGEMDNRRCRAPELVRVHLPAGIEGAVLWSFNSMDFEGLTRAQAALDEQLIGPVSRFFIEGTFALAALEFRGLGLERFVVLIGFHDGLPWCSIVPYDEEKAEDVSMLRWLHADFSRFTDRASESLSSTDTITAAIRVAPPSTPSSERGPGPCIDPLIRFMRDCGEAISTFNLYVGHIQRPTS
jgi:hypothetical protein